jgi:transcription initiation factor TFIIIB Brf1 subunit/transcription initiation factor TFIIB
MNNQITSCRSREVYDKNNDQHVHAIDRLVNELGIPAEEVNQSYREILDELKKDVKVKAFLPILVSQEVKERLKQK